MPMDHRQRDRSSSAGSGNFQVYHGSLKPRLSLRCPKNDKPKKEFSNIDSKSRQVLFKRWSEKKGWGLFNYIIIKKNKIKIVLKNMQNMIHTWWGWLLFDSKHHTHTHTRKHVHTNTHNWKLKRPHSVNDQNNHELFLHSDSEGGCRESPGESSQACQR